MTQDLGASLIFFVAFFAGLGVLLVALYYLEATLDKPVKRSTGETPTQLASTTR
jgi:hypothetical protein